MSPSLQTPNITACQPTTFQWSGSVAPYGIYLSTDVESSFLNQYGMEFDRIDSTSLVATTFFPSGTVVWATLYGNMSLDGTPNPYGTKIEGQGPFHVGEDSSSTGCEAVYSNHDSNASGSSGSSSNFTLVDAKLTPQQCQNITISWTGGTAPYKVLFQTDTPRTTFNSQISFTNVSGQDLTTKIPFAKGDIFNIYIAKGLGPGQLVTPLDLTVGDSNDSSCLFDASLSSTTTTSGIFTTSTTSATSATPAASAASTNSTTSAALSKRPLSSTARIGLAVGLSVFALLLIVVLGFYIRMRKKQTTKMTYLRPRPLDSPESPLNRGLETMVENRRSEIRKQINPPNYADVVDTSSGTVG